MEIPPHWYEVHSNMSPLAAFYLWHGLASSTCKTYSTGQKSYLDFVLLEPGLLDQPGRFLPATDRSIIEWVLSRSELLQCWTLQVGRMATKGGSHLYAWTQVGWTWLQLHGVGELRLPHCNMSVISETDNGAHLQWPYLGVWGSSCWLSD